MFGRCNTIRRKRSVKAQRIIFSVVYNADDKEQSDSGADLQTGIQKKRKDSIVWKNRSKQLYQDREHHHISSDFCDGFKCIHDATVEESCQRYFQTVKQLEKRTGCYLWKWNRDGSLAGGRRGGR